MSGATASRWGDVEAGLAGRLLDGVVAHARAQHARATFADLGTRRLMRLKLS